MNYFSFSYTKTNIIIVQNKNYFNIFLVAKYSQLFTLSLNALMLRLPFSKTNKSHQTFRQQQQLWNQNHLDIGPFLIQVQVGNDESSPMNNNIF